MGIYIDIGKGVPRFVVYYPVNLNIFFFGYALAGDITNQQAGEGDYG
jgi:hypothetical protein